MAIQLQVGEKDITRIVQAVRELVEGRHNAGGLVQLATSGTSTVVSQPNCSTECFPQITPANPAAAAEMGAGTCYVDMNQVQNGSFVIQHSASATPRWFYYLVTGG